MRGGFCEGRLLRKRTQGGAGGVHGPAWRPDKKAHRPRPVSCVRPARGTNSTVAARAGSRGPHPPRRPGPAIRFNLSPPTIMRLPRPFAPNPDGDRIAWSRCRSPTRPPETPRRSSLDTRNYDRLDAPILGRHAGPGPNRQHRESSDSGGASFTITMAMLKVTGRRHQSRSRW